MNPDEYQRTMQQQYDATAQFKRDNWPADFDGILVDATYLDIPDLVAIHKAAKALEAQGNEAFASELVVQKNGVKGSYDWSTSVRVNPLYLDRKRQQTAEICELLQAFYWGTCKGFKAKRQEIVDMGDAQLQEFVRQVDEALGLTFEEAKVMEIIE